MAGLCEGGNEPPGSLKDVCNSSEKEGQRGARKRKQRGESRVPEDSNRWKLDSMEGSKLKKRRESIRKPNEKMGTEEGHTAGSAPGMN
ncbi:hypothetical protein ANN_22628 [Periplaneta americana]|uniref:Uncharacterized protein n=1 Tax=Periplaneta americana TaxID=6978 RepID=A0ABQ8S8Z5_PERAM|nr:hypothetical protein ANN_22628 [Periplaneta americana]